MFYTLQHIDNQYGTGASYAEECLTNEVKIFVELQRDGALSPHVVRMLYYIREPVHGRLSHVVMELLPFGSLLALLRAGREGQKVWIRAVWYNVLPVVRDPIGVLLHNGKYIRIIGSQNQISGEFFVTSEFSKIFY